MANKIRYNANFGLDLDQVIGWKHVPIKGSNDRTLPKDKWHLEVYTHGNKITFIPGEEGYDYILKTLCEGCGFQPTEHTN